MDLIYILICFLVWFTLESQSQSFCGPNNKPVINVCTDQDVTKTRIIYIDTISVTDSQHTSCKCVITPNTHTVQLNLKLEFMSGRNGIQFKINNINVGKFFTNDKTDITGATKLSFSTLENHANDGVCLAVYSGNSELLNISCTQSTKKETTVLTRTSSISQGSELVNISSTRATRETTIRSRTPSVSQGSTLVNISSTGATREATIPSRTPSVSQESTLVNISSTRATRETTIPSSTPSISQDSIIRDDINVDSITRENTIQSTISLASQGSQSTLNRNKSTPYVSIDTQNSIESFNRPFCKYEQQPIVKVCTDDEVLNKRSMFIDTVSVPKCQQTSCECVVTPLEQHNTFNLNLKLEHLSGRHDMEFEINNISVGTYYDSKSTYVTGATKLLFSTNEKHRKKGVCLAVYSDGAHFNMHCKRSTIGTTSQSSQASTTGTTRQSSQASTTGTTRQYSPTSTKGTTRQSSPASISHESETTKITTLKYNNSSAQASKDKTTGINAIIIPTVSATCGLLCGIVIAVVCVIVYKSKKKGTGRHATMINPADANVESDYYMTENAMYNMGEICTRQPTNENEHHNVDHDAGAYAGVSPGHYDCIQESIDRNQSSDIAPTLAVSNDYSTCLKAGQVTAGGLNTSNNYQNYQPKCSRINGEDDTVYDSTKSTLPQQAVGDNDYHHLGSVGLNGLNLTYDKIGNTGLVKH